MAKRTNSPWSKTYKEGLPTTAVDDHVSIDRAVSGTITTGVIDSATGQWKGVTVSDDNFTIDAVHESVPNGGDILCPQATPQYIDMTGFNDLLIAIKPSNGGNIALDAVMGPADNYYANLSPVNPTAVLKGAYTGRNDMSAPFYSLLSDTGESLTVDVWNIFIIQTLLKEQKLLQFEITNNSGDASNIQFAYMRLV